MLPKIKTILLKEGGTSDRIKLKKYMMPVKQDSVTNIKIPKGLFWIVLTFICSPSQGDPFR